MKIIYLHIGMYKTGTSFIQKLCSKNYSNLAKKNIYYPTSARVGDLHYQLSLTNDQHKWLETIHQLKKEISVCGCDNILISIEHLINNCGDPDFAAQIKALFSPHTVKIIIYFRRQDEYLESLYNQEAKAWYAGSIQDFYRTEIAPQQSVCAQQFDYYFILSQLAKNFGKENVIAKAYEPDGSEKWLLNSFFEIFGFNDFQSFVIPQKNINGALKCETIAFLNKVGGETYQNNRFYSHFGGMKNALVEDFLSTFNHIDKIITGAKGYFYSPEQRKAMCLAYEESNAKAAREFLLSSEGIFFKEPFPDITQTWIPKELTSETIVEIMVALHFNINQRINALTVQRENEKRKLISLKLKKILNYKVKFMNKLNNQLLKLSTQFKLYCRKIMA